MSWCDCDITTNMIALKTLLVLALAVCYVKGTAEMMEMAQLLHTNCVEATGVAEEVIEDAQGGEFKEDEKLKCYMKCLFQELSMMDEEGNLDLSIMESMLPDEHKELWAKFTAACKDISGPNPCQKAFNVHLCIHKVSPDDYLLI